MNKGAATLAKIMVVEDNPDLRQALEIQLKSANYEMIWAEDAQDAVELCQRQKPDLLLLDLGLVGGDGFMVLERLKQLDAEMPVVVLSARDPELNEAHAIRLGAVAFMQKPAKWKDLLAVIRQFTDTGREEPVPG